MNGHISSVDMTELSPMLGLFINIGLNFYPINMNLYMFLSSIYSLEVVVSDLSIDQCICEYIAWVHICVNIHIYTMSEAGFKSNFQINYAFYKVNSMLQSKGDN